VKPECSQNVEPQDVSAKIIHLQARVHHDGISYKPACCRSVCVRVGAQRQSVSLLYQPTSTVASRSDEAVTLFCSSPLCTSGSTFIGLYPSALFPLPTLPATPSLACTECYYHQHYLPITPAIRRRRRRHRTESHKAKILIRKAQIPLILTIHLPHSVQNRRAWNPVAQTTLLQPHHRYQPDHSRLKARKPTLPNKHIDELGRHSIAWRNHRLAPAAGSKKLGKSSGDATARI